MIKTRLAATIKLGLIAIAIALSSSQATVSAQKEPPERSLEGVWEVTTTPRDCTTGEPSPPAFFGLYTFNNGQLVFQRYPFDRARVVATRTRLERLFVQASSIPTQRNRRVLRKNGARRDRNAERKR